MDKPLGKPHASVQDLKRRDIRVLNHFVGDGECLNRWSVIYILNTVAYMVGNYAGKYFVLETKTLN